MTQTNTLSNRLVAAVSAFALSLLLLNGTVAVPADAQTASPAAYVGVVA